MKIICVLLLMVLAMGSNIQQDLSQSKVRYEWNSTANQLNMLKSFTLTVDGLSEYSLRKIFREKMPQLRHLSFDKYAFVEDDLNYHIISDNIVLTPLIVQDIFTSEYFPNLVNLTMTNCNLDDRAFGFLDVNRSVQTSLKRLDLSKNMIGKRGLTSLAKIDFKEGLVELNLEDNLLGESESIEAIIKIVCGSNPEECIGSLESLDISETVITRQGFIRLFSRLNTKKIKKLTMNTLKILNKVTWQEGLNYSAFEFFASLPFPELTNISLSNSHITDEVLKLFSRMNLPKLQQLNLQKTEVGDAGIIKFINKKNLPMLSVLRLEETLLTDQGFKHIVLQNFSFTFIPIGNTKVTNDGFLLYTLMDLEIMTKLYIRGLNLQTSTLKLFFKKAVLTNLKSLNFAQNSEISDLFSYFPFQELENLQILRFAQIDISDSLLKMISKKKVLLPKLRYLYLHNVKNTNVMANYIVNQCSILFPKLQKLVLMEKSHIFISLEAFNDNISKLKDGFQIYFDWVTLRKMKNKFEVLLLNSLSYLYFRQNTESVTEESIFKEIDSMFDFTKIKMLQINQYQEMNVLSKYWSVQKVKNLPALQMLIFTFQINLQDFVQFMSQYTFPVLKSLMYNIKVSTDITNDYLLKKVVPLLERQKTLLEYIGHMDFLNEDDGRNQQKLVLDKLYYPFLKSIFIEDGTLQLYQIEKIIRIHNQTLRAMNVGGNFLEKGLMNLLAQTGCVLTKLGLSDTSFTVSEFALFGKVRTEFLMLIDLSRDDLTNDHLIEMIKTKGNELLFPKMRNVILEDNNIQAEGLEALLKTGMTNLFILPIDKNTNPNFINQLLTYPTGVEQIMADDIDVYSIRDDLNPSATINIKTITIKTSSFSSEDFHSLGRLSFDKLQVSRLLLINMYDCSVLQEILKINRNANEILLHFRNDQQGFNSSCLSEFLLNETYVSSIRGLTIEDEYVTTYLPEFIEIMVNSNRYLEFLVLSNTRLSPDVLVKIFDNNFHSLQALILRRNYLNDDSLSVLIENSMQHLKMLDISYTEITDEGVYALSRGFLLNMQFLDLSALESIGMTEMPNLRFLFLKNCRLKGDALITINTYRFKNLFSLDLSYNNFEENDIIDFVANIDRKLLPQLQALNLEGVEMSKSAYDTVVEILASKGFQQNFLTAPYNMKQTNAAHY